MGQGGTYVLVLHVNEAAEIGIGRLGTFSFPSGYYLYTGSARGPGGLEARLARHQRDRKPLRWHVDYLLGEATVIEIWRATSSKKLECLWAQTLLGMLGAETIAPGFGSSDCGCPTHLVRFPCLPSCEAFTTHLRALGSKPSPHREILGGPNKDQTA